MDILKAEPALILGIVQALLVLAVSLGLELDEDQKAAILALTAAVISVVTRQMVSPKA